MARELDGRRRPLFGVLVGVGGRGQERVRRPVVRVRRPPVGVLERGMAGVPRRGRRREEAALGQMHEAQSFRHAPVLLELAGDVVRCVREVCDQAERHRQRVRRDRQEGGRGTYALGNEEEHVRRRSQAERAA